MSLLKPYVGLLEDLPPPIIKDRPDRFEHQGPSLKPSAVSTSVQWKTAILVLACNRPTVSKCLDSLLQYLPAEGYSIIVSQDCGHQETADAIKAYSDRITYMEQPDRSEPEVDPGHTSLINYYKISRHYKWALGKIFDEEPRFEQVIIVEGIFPLIISRMKFMMLVDDMLIAPDFYDYFTAFMPLLQADPSLLCISAWNDNGKPERINDERQFYRTDFFPGLGWMMTRRLWNELKSKWPRAFWDDWLRNDEQMLGRSVFLHFDCDSCVSVDLAFDLKFRERLISVKSVSVWANSLTSTLPEFS